MKLVWLVLISNITHIPFDIYNIYKGKTYFIWLLLLGTVFVLKAARTIWLGKSNDGKIKTSDGHRSLPGRTLYPALYSGNRPKEIRSAQNSLVPCQTGSGMVRGRK